MAENKFPCASGALGTSGRELVCIETNRILDSCRDRDCFEDTRVFLTDFGNEILERTGNIRVTRACISYTSIHIDPIAFNRGFYCVNIRFYVTLCLEGCVGGGKSQEFEGVAVLDKRVVLYGGESNVNIFKSNPDATDYCSEAMPQGHSRNVPVAVVEVVDPIVLGCGVAERHKEDKNCCCCCCCDIPEVVCGRISGALTDGDDDHYLTVSLGVFSVVRIVRPAQYLVQATEYCVPDKECIAPCEEDPCAMFRGMAFPVGEFCPPGIPPIRPYDGGDRDHKKCGC